MNLLETDLSALKQELESSIGQVANGADLENLRRDWLGKEGSIKLLFKQLKDVPSEKKPAVAGELNQLKSLLESFISEKSEQLKDSERKAAIISEFFDFSIPGTSPGFGTANPIRMVERRIGELLSPFGFRVVEGPEIETEYYCFDGLNIPKHHPARDMQDTFYTDTGHVLRTHTTSVQARELEKGELPVKIISTGRAYRNETEDASHQAMFHQYELVWIDEGIRLSHLMGVLSHILKGLYGKRRKVRFVPKYYPYTEPSLGAQVDCILCKGKGCSSCGGAGWVTILGSGMVHRKVLEEFGYDPEKVSGMAFGLGTARLAAQFYNASNLKVLYENDLRALGGM